MSVPNVLFVTSCDLSPEHLIEKVLNCPLPTPQKIDNNITSYLYKIDNKYYTTTINLCAVSNKSIGDEHFSSLVDGVIIAFDACKSDSLEKVEAWLPFIDCYDAEIKILVCNECPDDGLLGIQKRSAQEWCVQKRFELVELNSNADLDPDDDFPETLGVERIRQALSAHQWCNLVLKDSSHNFSSLNIGNHSKEEEVSAALAESLEEMLDNDSFGELFSQLAEMKERVGNMSGTARQDAAEQVVRAFWNALGGEDEDL